MEYSDYKDVWSFGLNEKGQLGLGDKINRNIPQLVSNIKAKSISACDSNSGIIDEEDNVWMFGDDSNSKLGLGFKCNFKNEQKPIKIEDFKAKQLSIGKHHTVLLDLENNVWVFGSNNYGQLGYDNGIIFSEFINYVRNIPTRALVPKCKHVSAGGYHTILIDENDDVWAFGDNAFGQLGLNKESVKKIHNPTKIPEIKAKYASAGELHTAIIDLDDNVWVFGLNKNGELGIGIGDNITRYNPTQIENFKARHVSCGSAITVIIDMEYNLWVFGANNCGQLGLGDKNNRNIPTKIPDLKVIHAAASVGSAAHVVVIDINNNPWIFGYEYTHCWGIASKPRKINNFKAKQIAAGGLHTLMIAKNVPEQKDESLIQ